MTGQSDAELHDILSRTKAVAIVGFSTNPVRASYFVGRYLSLRGYEVWPVNPRHAGTQVFGRRIVGDVSYQRP